MHNHNDTRLNVQAAALGSLGAGLIHVVVSPGHWEEWAPLGASFAVLALIQIVWAIIAFRAPDSRWLALVIPVNIGTIAVWAASRIWGLPIGPAAGAPESVVVAGVVATLLEAFVVVAVASALVPRVQQSVVHSGWYKGALATTAMVVALLAAPAMLTAAAGHDHIEGEGDLMHGTEDGESHDAEPTPNSETAPQQAETGPPSATTDAPGGETSESSPLGSGDTEDHAEDPHGH
jgi:hypothetical protein